MNELDLKLLSEYFDSQPIDKVWLFGSYARGTQSEESDIDILVKFNDNSRIGLLTYAKIIEELKNIIKKDVDLVEEGSFYPWVEQNVAKEKILIYERENQR